MMKTEGKISRQFPPQGRSALGGAPAGFTLTELLVAMLVLAVGCMAVINMQTSVINAGDRASNMSVATFLAESQAEWVKTMELDRVRFESDVPEKLLWDSSPCPEGTAGRRCFTRTTTTTCFTPTSRSCTVSVKVEWQAADGPHQLVANAIVSAFGF